MSITDELREFLDGMLFKGEAYERLTAIADRIDEEHERLMRVDYDRKMDASGYVRLPEDADGVSIRIGDVMKERSGHTFEVASLMAFGGWDNWLVLSDPRSFSSFREPHDIRHVQPDSWERIIEDATSGADFTFEVLVERCKRLAGEQA